MQTQLLQVSAQAPEADCLAQAAEVLRGGGLVAFPTETVYGLGADATNPAAVARLFAAKGRPPTNPLIVHVPDLAGAWSLFSEFPAVAHVLAKHFWPGPLTIVLRKSDRALDQVTAGGSTVAVRAPAHPVALGLLRLCRLPLAAPSANPSSLLSPTTAEHVLKGLGGKIDMVLDAGPTPGGLESTVIDATVTPPRVLRPGLVTAAQIEAVIGPVELGPPPSQAGAAKSPGLRERHYAPRTPLECAADGRPRVAELVRQGIRVGWVTMLDEAPTTDVVVERLPEEAAAYAAGLYAALHRLDHAGVERIVVDLPPQGDAWSAIHDRLRRAATK
jgi:L-threonylcarbamoyladenylate synthase